jgi:hypothetical protein
MQPIMILESVRWEKVKEHRGGSGEEKGAKGMSWLAEKFL